MFEALRGLEVQTFSSVKGNLTIFWSWAKPPLASLKNQRWQDLVFASVDSLRFVFLLSNPL
jgi:hypothetical protein